MKQYGFYLLSDGFGCIKCVGFDELKQTENSISKCCKRYRNCKALDYYRSYLFWKLLGVYDKLLTSFTIYFDFLLNTLKWVEHQFSSWLLVFYKSHHWWVEWFSHFPSCLHISCIIQYISLGYLATIWFIGRWISFTQIELYTLLFCCFACLPTISFDTRMY